MEFRLLIAAIRAEIEREGIPVHVSDMDLWEAVFSPLEGQLVELRRGTDELSLACSRAKFAIDELARTLRDG